MDSFHEAGAALWLALKPWAYNALAALVVWLVGVGIAYAKEQVAALKNERWRDLLMVAVRAAEQKYESGEGEAKFNYVVDYLAARGLAVDETEIEAEVYWLSRNVKPTCEADNAPPKEAA